MKIAEFLALTDDDKLAAMNECDARYGESRLERVTEDAGVCSQCGGEADAGTFCFGCHRLVCSDCFEEGPHLAECVQRVRS